MRKGGGGGGQAGQGVRLAHSPPSHSPLSPPTAKDASQRVALARSGKTVNKCVTRDCAHAPARRPLPAARQARPAHACPDLSIAPAGRRPVSSPSLHPSQSVRPSIHPSIPPLRQSPFFPRRLCTCIPVRRLCACWLARCWIPSRTRPRALTSSRNRSLGIIDAFPARARYVLRRGALSRIELRRVRGRGSHSRSVSTPTPKKRVVTLARVSTTRVSAQQQTKRYVVAACT